MAYLAAAIDIGTWSCKLVLGKVGVKKVQITGFREIPYTRDDHGAASDEEIGRAIHECLAALPQKPEMACTAVSGRDIFLRILSLPKAGLKRIDQIASLQIEDDLPVSLDEYVVDAVPLRDMPDGKLVECMVVAARKDLIRATIERLAGAGMDPSEITCGPMIYPATPSLPGAPALPEPLAILDMGHTSSELVIIEGGRAALFRSVMWGGRNVTERIAKHYAITFPHAETVKEEYGALVPDRPAPPGSMEEQILALCREAADPFVLDLRQSFMGYASRSGQLPQRLFLCGGTARLRGAARHLQVQLGVDTQVLGDEDAQSTRLVRARALMGDTVRADTRRINFRKDAFVFEGKVNVVRRRWIRAVALAAVIIVGWFVYAMAQIGSLEKVIEKQSADLEAVTKEISGEAVADFDRAKILLKSTAAVKSPVPKADAFDILVFMSEQIPEDVVHDVEELDIRSDRWRIRGIVDSISDRDKVYEALIQYKDCIKSISKGKTTLSPKDNRQKYNFDMEVQCP